jgi:cytidylate kinase
VVTNLAERGKCVIVGHAGQVILKKSPSVFKVLVTGSPERRTARIAEEQGLTPKDAVAYVKDSDHQRIAFFKHVYNVDWLDSSLYDLGVNTDDVDVETAVSMVLTCIEKTP